MGRITSAPGAKVGIIIQSSKGKMQKVARNNESSPTWGNIESLRPPPGTAFSVAKVCGGLLTASKPDTVYHFSHAAQRLQTKVPICKAVVPFPLVIMTERRLSCTMPYTIFYPPHFCCNVKFLSQEVSMRDLQKGKKKRTRAEKVYLLCRVRTFLRTEFKEKTTMSNNLTCYDYESLFSYTKKPV